MAASVCCEETALQLCEKTRPLKCWFWEGGQGGTEAGRASRPSSRTHRIRFNTLGRRSGLIRVRRGGIGVGEESGKVQGKPSWMSCGVKGRPPRPPSISPSESSACGSCEAGRLFPGVSTWSSSLVEPCAWSQSTRLPGLLS